MDTKISPWSLKSAAFVKATPILLAAAFFSVAGISANSTQLPAANIDDSASALRSINVSAFTNCKVPHEGNRAVSPGKTQHLTAPDQVPEGLAKSDWASFSKTASGSWTTGGKEFFINGVTNKLSFGGFGLGGEVSSAGVITNDGMFHHVAVTFVDSTNTLTFYIDGVASDGGTLNLPADVASHVVKMGGHPSGHNFFGQMDEFRIFSRDLSPSEIVTVKNNPIIP